MGIGTVTGMLVGLSILPPNRMTAVAAPWPVPSPPGTPSPSIAQNELSELTVVPQGSQDGYDRDKFPHWITQNGFDIRTLFAYAYAECLSQKL